ncbi:SMI1/KNR4 family protein [Hymenobacter jeollabukensis]|uniref:SMI1/KNR4 family protein n=1 Tax=Hymenobacter jeollabukensis TaxID=2025313 RepID=A0A5R8WX28_9BACT|nr:SMI1/KNR4 family protein [Hymenobacter jeollabukensis]TLM97090.1 SMI1/KNR4 family protein [Hymenobacter jeollabukensis]
MITLQAIIDKLRANQHRLGIELNPPAPEAAIQQLEQALGRPLPPDIAAFYRYCNGFECVQDFLFKINPIDWILEFSGQLAAQRFEVADYLISSDVWEVVLDPTDLARYRIINANHGMEAEVTLTDSLYAFISRYLDGEGYLDLYQWYEQVKQQLP